MSRGPLSSLPQPRRVVIWRHGRTQWNAEGRFQGQLDPPLDEVGVQQVVRAARLLHALAPARVVASDLQRARATAEALGRLCGCEVPVRPEFRETHGGNWQGLDRAQLDADHRVELAAWADGADIPAGQTGERRSEVARRMTAGLVAELAHVPVGATLVVATHGGSGRALTGAMMGLPLGHWAALGTLANASWTVLVERPGGLGPDEPEGVWGAGAWRLEEYNAGTLPQPAVGDDR